MNNHKELFKTRKHGIDLPEWFWNMITECKIRTAKPSNRSYIVDAVIAKAKQDGVWESYERIVSLNRKKGVQDEPS